MPNAEDRYAFNVEWYDSAATIVRKYILLFYPKDNAVEMFDVKNNRPFLKRTKCEGLRLVDLHIGSSVNVLSRQLRVVDFADDWSKKCLQTQTEKTIGIIRPHAMERIGEIISDIEKNGFIFVNLKMFQLSRKQSFDLYEDHRGKSFFENLVNSMTSGPMLAFELMRDNAVEAWREMIGPVDPEVAKQQAPRSLRARYGINVLQNAIHGSNSVDEMIREARFLFPDNGCSIPNTASIQDSTCAVIKPHIIAAGKLGAMIVSIMNGGFEISAVRMYNLDKANAEEFLEVYKGVLAEYTGILQEFISGPCVAMEIKKTGVRQQQNNSQFGVQKLFRDFVGPMDPEMARHLRPHTLRAIYGKDKISNAIHCTDLPDDAQLEVQYFFEILDR